MFDVFDFVNQIEDYAVLLFDQLLGFLEVTRARARSWVAVDWYLRLMLRVCSLIGVAGVVCSELLVAQVLDVFLVAESWRWKLAALKVSAVLVLVRGEALLVVFWWKVSELRWSRGAVCVCWKVHGAEALFVCICQIEILIFQKSISDLWAILVTLCHFRGFIPAT